MYLLNVKLFFIFFFTSKEKATIIAYIITIIKYKIGVFMTIMDKLVIYMVLIIIFETILECLRWPFDHLVLGVNWLLGRTKNRRR